jgi:hypothetical protein
MSALRQRKSAVSFDHLVGSQQQRRSGLRYRRRFSVWSDDASSCSHTVLECSRDCALWSSHHGGFVQAIALPERSPGSKPRVIRWAGLTTPPSVQLRKLDGLL